ncbi:sensor histidine kinase [Aquibium sp. LZ166]|uniref:histidine kinase n=1 Tax=Aquibium pacificus TaxID=3153579 RepID=A0ABV3SQD1_9HYPH
MTPLTGIKAALPFIAIGAALLLSVWAFFRSEHYRAESDLNYSQNYEIQWRTTQIREHLARIHGDLKLSAATGQLASDLSRQTFLLDANVGQLLKLDYAPKFLRDRDMQLLNELHTIAQTHLDPLVKGSTNFGAALKVMPGLEQRMFEVSGTAVAHAEALNAASHIGAAASRNRFLFAAALTLAAACYTVLHLRNAFARRRDQQLSSFSTLFAHMTRSRVTALRFFLDYQSEETVRYPEMLAAAREAVKQLDTITTGLNTVAYADAEVRRKRLSETLEDLKASRHTALELRIAHDAGAASLPAAQMWLVLDEILQNAEAALGENPDGLVKIVARIADRPIKRQRRLLLDIIDNGPGMPPDVLARAKMPFFSTKAGRHTGLGLAGCAQMVSALRGTLTIASRPGHGTAVQISLPI